MPYSIGDPLTVDTHFTLFRSAVEAAKKRSEATGDVAYSQVGYSVRREACEAEFRQSFPEAAAHRELRASSEFEREMRETRDKRRQPR